MSRSADLEASLGEVDRQNMDVGHALLLRTRLEGARWHLTMPAGGGIHPISSVEEAMARFGKPEIFNTDQDSQFTSREFTSLLDPPPPRGPG